MVVILQYLFDIHSSIQIIFFSISYTVVLKQYSVSGLRYFITSHKRNTALQQERGRLSYLQNNLYHVFFLFPARRKSTTLTKLSFPRTELHRKHCHMLFSRIIAFYFQNSKCLVLDFGFKEKSSLYSFVSFITFD